MTTSQRVERAVNDMPLTELARRLRADEPLTRIGREAQDLIEQMAASEWLNRGLIAETAQSQAQHPDWLRALYADARGADRAPGEWQEEYGK